MEAGECLSWLFTVFGLRLELLIEDRRSRWARPASEKGRDAGARSLGASSKLILLPTTMTTSTLSTLPETYVNVDRAQAALTDLSVA